MTGEVLLVGADAPLAVGGAADTAWLVRNVLLVDHRVAPDVPAWRVEEADGSLARAVAVFV